MLQSSCPYSLSLSGWSRDVVVRAMLPSPVESIARVGADRRYPLAVIPAKAGIYGRQAVEHQRPRLRGNDEQKQVLELIAETKLVHTPGMVVLVATTRLDVGPAVLVVVGEVQRFEGQVEVF